MHVLTKQRRVWETPAADSRLNSTASAVVALSMTCTPTRVARHLHGATSTGRVRVLPLPSIYDDGFRPGPEEERVEPVVSSS